MASWLVAGDSPGRGWCSFQEGYGHDGNGHDHGGRFMRDMARGL